MAISSLILRLRRTTIVSCQSARQIKLLQNPPDDTEVGIVCEHRYSTRAVTAASVRTSTGPRQWASRRRAARWVELGEDVVDQAAAPRSAVSRPRELLPVVAAEVEPRDRGPR